MNKPTLFQVIIVVLLIGALVVIVATGDSERDREHTGLWELSASSDPAMTTAVREAIANGEPIVATVWEPHSTFALEEGELRKLNDPEQIYNDPARTRSFLEANAPSFADLEVESDVIATVVPSGFADEAPLAYRIFQNFSINPGDDSAAILEITVEGRTAEEVANEWYENNQDVVSSWIPDEQMSRGRSTITIGIPPWAGESFRSRILALALEDAGYETEIRELDPGVVYASLAENDLDVTVGGWLPTTHQSFWEQVGDDLEIAGVNISQTWLGLAVPASTSEQIQSIGDLAGESAFGESVNYQIIGIDAGAGIMQNTQRAIEVYEL